MWLKLRGDVVGRWFLLWALLALTLLAGCRQRESERPELATEPAPTIIPLGGRPAVIRHSDLLNSPSQYSGALVQLSGQFQRLPRLVCEGEIYRSPAGWKLRSGELFVQVAGFETALRPLSSSTQTITIQGVWRRWEGLVGCGAAAQLQEIWYLEASRVVEPNPILFGTPTVGEPIVLITPTPDLSDDGRNGGELPPPGDNGQPEEPPDRPTEPSAPTPTSTATPTIPPTGDATPTHTATPGNDLGDPGAPGSGATPTPTNTPDPNGGTGTVTPTATATPGNGAPPPPPGVITPQGNLPLETVVSESLAANSSHSWSLKLEAGETITVSVIGDRNLRVALSVERPDGSLIVNGQNNAGAGQVETAVFETTTAGDYLLLVTAVGAGGAYALVALDELAFNIAFAGNLSYGDNIGGRIPPETDQYWFFSAVAGDSVTITVAPVENEWYFIGLFGPDGRLVGSFAQSGGPGQPAELRTVLLTTTGYYSLLIQEFDLREGSYRVRLQRN